MQVPDSLVAGWPARQAETVSPVQARAHDAFWQDVFDAATVVQGQADQGLPAAADGACSPAMVHTPGGAAATMPSPAVRPPPVPEPVPLADTVPHPLAGLATKETPTAIPIAFAQAAHDRPMLGRGSAPSAQPPAPGSGKPEPARALALAWSGEPSVRDSPWHATFVVDAAGQRRLFLRSSELDDAQAMALAARLDQTHPGRDRALDAIHLNGRPIYQQPRDGASDTLLVC